MNRRLSVLFVFDWLVVGGEETEVRLLAQNLDRGRYDLGVAACFRNERMTVGSSRVDLQACKLEYSIVSPK